MLCAILADMAVAHGRCGSNTWVPCLELTCRCTQTTKRSHQKHKHKVLYLPVIHSLGWVQAPIRNPISMLQPMGSGSVPLFP